MNTLFKNTYTRIAIALMMLAFINASLTLKAEEYTVTVSAPGQLQNNVNQLVGGSANYYLISSLIVIGNMNRDDVYFLQDLGYVTSQGGLGILENLDISQTHLPNNTLPSFAFSYVDIDNITLPNSVQTYEWQCFFNSNTKYIKVGTATSFLFEDETPYYNSYDYTAFSNTREMIAYEVASDNDHFVSIDGVIYSKDMKQLIAYPGNKADNTFAIPEGVEKICFAACSNTSNLNSLSFPNSLKTISDYGFTGGEGLSNIQWGSGLEIIGYSAFMRAENMGELTLPEGLETIVSSAFYSTGITKITGPTTLLNIGYDCFRGDGFAGSTLETVDFSACTNLLKIEGSAFYDCHYLVNVYLPEGLRIIGDASFQNCYSIQEITIPHSVETIEVNAFWMFSELYEHEMEKVILGSGLQQIQENAFGECTHIELIESWNPVPPSLASDGFEAAINNSCVVRVPEGSLAAYEAANRWQDFQNIEETLTTGIEAIADSDCEIYTSNNKLIIRNAKPGEQARIYSATGAAIKTIKISSSHQEIALPRGIYIVLVNGSSAKIVI